MKHKLTKDKQMKTTTKIVLAILAVPVAAVVLYIPFSDTSPRRMAEVDVNTCYRNLPSATDIFAAAQRHRALEQCKAMKALYESTYKVKYTNY